MSVQRTHGSDSLIDVFDRVLDKGVVIDAWVRQSLIGIDLVTADARIVTYTPTHRQSSASGGRVRLVLTRPDTFGNVLSSRSALARDDGDDDGDDDDGDDDGGGGSDGTGSGGAPALVEHPLRPRLRQPSPRERTRRRRT